MGWRAIEVEVILLDVLAVIALAIGQAKKAFLYDRIFAVPQRHRKAQQLLIVRYSGEPVLAPTVRPRTRLIMAEIVPGIAVFAVVFAHGSPLSLGQVRTPRFPRHPRGSRFLQPSLLCNDFVRHGIIYPRQVGLKSIGSTTDTSKGIICWDCDWQVSGCEL
jgi:hypothetical protein